MPVPVQSAFDRLTQLEKFEAGAPATDGQIAHVEKRLGIVLPPSYRSFLRRFGHASWFGGAVYGVYNPAPGVVDEKFDYCTIRETLRARKKEHSAGFAPLPKGGNIVASYDGGGYFFLYGANVARPGQVVLLANDDKGREAQAWPTLEAWLEWLMPER